MVACLAYKRTGNLGDVIQTIALARLLGEPCVGYYRDELHRYPAHEHLILNGWVGESIYRGPVTVAGVHLGRRVEEHKRWLLGLDQPIGVRDPWTLGYVGHGKGQMIGCATLTLPRYEGPRRGVVYVDHTDTCLTHRIPQDWSWEQQWTTAMQRLELYMKAELVVTSRLHVLLPCIAFGTPVVCHSKEVKRFSLARSIGWESGKEYDGAWEYLPERYKLFLGGCSDTALADTVMPVAVSGQKPKENLL